MLQQIRYLVKLQTLDNSILSLTIELQNISLQLNEIDQDQNRLSQKIKKINAELNQINEQQFKLEAQLETTRFRLNKAEDRIMKTKNQREYQAMSTEKEDAITNIKIYEDLLIELIERQEKLQNEVKITNEQHSTVSIEIEAQRHKIFQRSKKIKCRLQELSSERCILVKNIEGSLLKQYNFLHKRKQGIALAPVSKGTCQTCHMDISPQQFNELQRLDKIIICESCKRLLYWADAEALADLL